MLMACLQDFEDGHLYALEKFWAFHQYSGLPKDTTVTINPKVWQLLHTYHAIPACLLLQGECIFVYAFFSICRDKNGQCCVNLHGMHASCQNLHGMHASCHFQSSEGQALSSFLRKQQPVITHNHANTEAIARGETTFSKICYEALFWKCLFAVVQHPIMQCRRLAHLLHNEHPQLHFKHAMSVCSQVVSNCCFVKHLFQCIQSLCCTAAVQCADRFLI